MKIPFSLVKSGVERAAYVLKNVRNELLGTYMRRRQFFGAAFEPRQPSLPPLRLLPRCPPQPALADSLAPQATANSTPPFKLSVMLWTVYEKLPFDQRIEKVAEAGYHAVELVNEYKNFTKKTTPDSAPKTRTPWLTVDATSGITHSLCDPSQRERPP